MSVNVKPVAAPDVVLAKATANASDLLGLSGAALGRVIGLSDPTISRIKGGGVIDPKSKEGQLAMLLIRVFRSLDPLVGMDDQKRKKWMSSQNKDLGGIPAKLIETPDGLSRTLQYLDGMRAPT